MASLEELEQRLSALEGRVGMEAGLRASGDRDLSNLASTLRAQHHVLQALALTSSEHNQRLAEVTGILREHDLKFEAVERQLGTIIGLLNRLIEEPGQ